MELSLDALRGAFGLGVAGNFAGHLEQAGEAADFVSVQAAGEAPKGIFPFYVPGDDGFLGTFPLSHDEIRAPAEAGDLQIEPEVGVLCTVRYDEAGACALEPAGLGAFNDCSIRRPGAPKISHKKNWGPASTGVARTFFPITDLAPDGPTATFRLACFLRRHGDVQDYGVDSPLPGYSYYGTTLLDWIVDRLRHQEGAPETPLEPVGRYLVDAGRPDTALIGIGATRYTAVGESTYVVPGDDVIVVVYDAAVTTPEDLATAVIDGQEDAVPAASVLRQRVR